MGFAQEKHQSAGLADAAVDRQWQHTVYDSPVIRELQVVEKVGHLELLTYGFGVDADSHRNERAAAPCDVIPDRMSPFKPWVSLFVSLLNDWITGTGGQILCIGCLRYRVENGRSP